MKRKDLIRTIRANGAEFVRNGGSHDIYQKGKRIIEVPRHNEVNERTAKEIIKQSRG